MNGLPALASQLASKGRGEDSMLIHMTPGEVRGLQSLAMAHGGSLTINPDTGLPEAGFLKSILPTLVGVGLMMTPFGQAIGAPMIGAGIGGFEALRTGDLGRGLMAGLGAYGGAGLGSALTSAGAGTVGTAGLEQLGGPVTAAPATFSESLAAAGEGLKNLNTTQGWSNLGAGLQEVFPTTAGKVAAATPLISSVAEATAPKYEYPTAEEDTGFNYEGPYTPTERQVSFKPFGDRSSSEYTYFTPSNPVPFAEGGETQLKTTEVQDVVSEIAKNDPNLINGFFGGSSPSTIGGKGGTRPEVRGAVRMPTMDRIRAGGGEFDYGFRPISVVDRVRAANPAPANIGGKGGRLLRAVSESTTPQIAPQESYRDLSAYEYDPMTQQLVKRAGGGLTALAAGGRYLKGPGDGTSDDIPAVIGDKQPARLADGEFVIDARTVSEIGNGSSNAGAKKLYAMMDRVHSARKKAKRGQDTKAERYMPA